MPEERRGDRERDDTEQFRKLFVGGLHQDTTEETLKEYFERWGEVVDSVVMKDPHTKRSRGFGFITYKSVEMVDEAQSARPHRIDQRDVEVKRAMPREDATRPDSHLTVKKIFLSGIKDEIQTEDLQEYFSKFGEVKEVDIIVEKETGRKRGFAFITFNDYDPVDKVVLMRHHMIHGHRCDAKKALSKEDMRDSKIGGGRGGRDGGRDRRGRGDTWGGGLGSSYSEARGGGPMKGEGYGWRDAGPYGGGYGGYGYGGGYDYYGGYDGGYGGGYGGGDRYGGGGGPNRYGGSSYSRR